MALAASTLLYRNDPVFRPVDLFVDAEIVVHTLDARDRTRDGARLRSFQPGIDNAGELDDTARRGDVDIRFLEGRLLSQRGADLVRDLAIGVCTLGPIACCTSQEEDRGDDRDAQIKDWSDALHGQNPFMIETPRLRSWAVD